MHCTEVCGENESVWLTSEVNNGLNERELKSAGREDSSAGWGTEVTLDMNRLGGDEICMDRWKWL